MPLELIVLPQVSSFLNDNILYAIKGDSAMVFNIFKMVPHEST